MILIKGDPAASIAAVEKQIGEFKDRVNKEHQLLEEHFAEVIYAAAGVTKADIPMHELALTTKYYKDLGFMIVEREASMFDEVFKTSDAVRH